MPLSQPLPDDTHVSLNPLVGLDLDEYLQSLGEICEHAATHPLELAQHISTLLTDWCRALLGETNSAPGTEDRRFVEPAWHEELIFRTELQCYLAWTRAINGLIDGIPADNEHRQQLRFVANALTAALAPSNFWATNPVALKQAIATGGLSLWAGWNNFLHDLVTNHGLPAQVEKSSLRIGENMAASRGKVVCKTDLFELIEYAPLTPRIYERPQLLIPPVVNKFYLLDLAPEQSMVEFLLDSQFHTFSIAWRNPSPEHRDWGLDQYVNGILEALHAVLSITGSADVNLHGTCGGARLMAALLGYLAATKQQTLIHSASIIAVNLITDETAHGLFASPAAMERARQKSQAAGVLDGKEIVNAFNWIQPNDLIWKYWINNYLLGHPPPSSEIFYWSSDCTRLPARLHADLLRLYAGNLFTRPGELTVLGKPIDLAQVDREKFVVAGTRDHISPWPHVYRSARLFGGPLEFVLNYGGHVPTIVNPPTNTRARYIVNPDADTEIEVHDWARQGELIGGSWWLHWRTWIAHRSGKLISAPVTQGNRLFPPLSEAPGNYVHEP